MQQFNKGVSNPNSGCARAMSLNQLFQFVISRPKCAKTRKAPRDAIRFYCSIVELGPHLRNSSQSVMKGKQNVVKMTLMLSCLDRSQSTRI